MKLIKNAQIVNEGKIITGSVLINKNKIIKIYYDSEFILPKNCKIIDAENHFLLPGIIDDQVHFREPGFPSKADIYTESKAAVAGGITSYMEMPNTNPQTITQELLQKKFELAAEKSLANFSFYIGATNDNIEELLKTDPKKVCGIKIFMGASTGNMLVDKQDTLIEIFSKSKMLIAVHCEDEATIQKNIEKYKNDFGEYVPIKFHPKIRSESACYKSSSLAVRLAKKYGTRLHVLHLSTGKEIGLFNNLVPASEKQITAEVCIHHLWFSSEDYDKYGSLIKWNPSIKTKSSRDKLFQALLDNKLDVVATDHAPHTLEEKNNSYFKSPSGGPLVQHSLPAMLEFYRQEKISLEKIVEKMCHAPADIFKIKNRGYIREGYFADLVIVDTNSAYMVAKKDLLYKCGWSPFEGTVFNSKITHTFVNGNLVYENGKFAEKTKGMRLEFAR